MRIRLAGLTMLMFVLWTGISPAEEAWTEFRSAEHGFAMLFPGTPRITSSAVEGRNPLVQFECRVEAQGSTYELAAFEFSAGRGPRDPNAEFFARVIAAYAKGSGSTLRTQYPVTIDGYPGMEAIVDDEAGDVHHLLDVIVVGDRIYLIVSAGPQGHEASAEAWRFRDSFRLITP